MRMACSGSRAQPERSAASSERQRRSFFKRHPSVVCLPVVLFWFSVYAWSISVRHEDVAFVADRADEARMFRVRLDLLAQAHDAQVDAAVERIPVALAVQVEDALARLRAVRM